VATGPRRPDDGSPAAAGGAAPLWGRLSCCPWPGPAALTTLLLLCPLPGCACLTALLLPSGWGGRPDVTAFLLPPGRVALARRLSWCPRPDRAAPWPGRAGPTALPLPLWPGQADPTALPLPPGRAKPTRQPPPAPL